MVLLNCVLQGVGVGGDQVDCQNPKLLRRIDVIKVEASEIGIMADGDHTPDRDIAEIVLILKVVSTLAAIRS